MTDLPEALRQAQAENAALRDQVADLLNRLMDAAPKETTCPKCS